MLTYLAYAFQYIFLVCDLNTDLSCSLSLFFFLSLSDSLFPSLTRDIHAYTSLHVLQVYTRVVARRNASECNNLAFAQNCPIET